MGRLHSNRDFWDRAASVVSQSVVWLLALSFCFACAWLIGDTLKHFVDLIAVRACADQYLTEVAAGRIGTRQERPDNALPMNKTRNRARCHADHTRALTTETARTYSLVKVYRGSYGLQALVQVRVHGPSDSMSFTLILSREDGEWKVDQCYHDDS